MTSITRWKRSKRFCTAFFGVAADVQVGIGPAVGESVDQARIAVEGDDDVSVGGEQSVVVAAA